jgi:hypothetical protein
VNARKASKNPKDLAASDRVDISLLPTSGIIHGAHACMDGARKYGPYNWRDEPIRVMGYLSATMRHIQAFIDGEDTAPDSKCHHLGHAIATCAILLDAFENESVIDDRPKKGRAAAILSELKDKLVRVNNGSDS